MLIGAVNVVLFTALATLGAFIYNVCADLVGGVELTLAENATDRSFVGAAARLSRAAAPVWDR